MHNSKKLFNFDYLLIKLGDYKLVILFETAKYYSIYHLKENFINFELKNMPTVLRTRGYRFFFYINDHHPAHIHVEKERSTAKFFLKNAELVRSKRFNAGELNEIRKIILENIELFKTKWDEHFTDY